MNDGLIFALAGLGVTVLMMALRMLNRAPAAPEPEGVAVYHGDQSACSACVDLLADAGIPAWTEGSDSSDQIAVHVDLAQAEAVPELLRQRPKADNPLRVPTPLMG